MVEVTLDNSFLRDSIHNIFNKPKSLEYELVIRFFFIKIYADIIYGSDWMVSSDERRNVASLAFFFRLVFR